MSAFERAAVQRVIDNALAAGVVPPAEVYDIRDRCGTGAQPGVWWEEQNPQVNYVGGCCDGDVHRGPGGCTCWTPVYDVEQAAPIRPGSPDDLQVRPDRCHDCAFRRDSPERRDESMRETLYALADEGQPFWCHDGMRRPARWVHPDGRTVAGDPADWHPAMVLHLPHRADGRVALLCAGWAARVRAGEVRHG